MTDEPRPGEKRKLSEASKSRLKREALRVEDGLEKEFQRPIEMRKEAESLLATFPPWPAIASVIFGMLMALSVVPSSLAVHSATWARQEKQLAVLETPEAIDRFPAGQNWRAVTLMLPFAVIFVGLTIWGRRHKLAYLGLALYAFSIFEAAFVAGACEWYDGRSRAEMARELRVKRAEECDLKRQTELQSEQDEQMRLLDFERYRLETERQKRRMADQDAARQAIYQRQRAEMDVAAKAEQQRQRQEDERSAEEAQRRTEDEQRSKAENERKGKEAEERRLAELERAREVRAKQLTIAEEKLAKLTASHDELLKRKAERATSIAECEEKIKANAVQEAQLQTEWETQEGIVRACDQLSERATEKRDAAKIKGSTDARKQADDVIKAVGQRKAAAEKEKREVKSKVAELQADSKKAEAEIKRLGGEVVKMEASLEALAGQITATQTAIRDLR